MHDGKPAPDTDARRADEKILGPRLEFILTLMIQVKTLFFKAKSPGLTVVEVASSRLILVSSSRQLWRRLQRGTRKHSQISDKTNAVSKTKASLRALLYAARLTQALRERC